MRNIETYFGLLHPPGLFDRERSWPRNWPNVIWKLDILALLWRSCCNMVKTASETSCDVGIFLWLVIVGHPIGVPRLWRSAYFAPTYTNKAKSNTKPNQNTERGRAPKSELILEHVFNKVRSTMKAICIRMLPGLSVFTAQKMKFSIMDFFSKCNQIRRFLWNWSHLLKKSLMENLIFCAVSWFRKKLSTRQKGAS